MSLMLVALWLPVSMHCSLEIIPGFNLLDLCCDTAAAENPKDDCRQDNCAEIEAGLYRVEDNPPLTSDLSVLLTLASPRETLSTPKPVQANSVPADSSPPELISSWQFSSRAALPVRAPSSFS